MPAYQLFDQLRSFTGEQGQLVAGGELRFFDAGTTTPKDVFGNPGLSVNNGATIGLDASARPDVPVWGDGDYKVELYDTYGVKQGEIADLVSPSQASSGLPAFEAGKFLTNDGLQAIWDVIRQLPDPTGQSGKVLSTDGSGFVWITKPADGAAGTSDMTTAPGSLTFGSGENKIGIKYGPGTAPASGGHTTFVDVTFPAPFSEAPGFVVVSPTVNVVAAGGYQAVTATTNVAATGFRMNVDVNSSGAASDINVPIPFLWFAIGKVP